MGPSTPRWPESLLKLFLRSDLAEEILGDLEEKFQKDVQAKTLIRAKINYWYQVLNYLRPFAMKRYYTPNILHPMFKHNLTISFRIIRKNKAFSAINIGGLAIGMIVFFLIGLWIQDELSFNQSHEKYESIVQVFRKDTYGTETQVNNSQVSMVGVFLEKNYPHLFDKVAMTFFRNRPQLLQFGERSFERPGYFMQRSGPTLLTLEMISGTQDGLADPRSIMLSQPTSNLLFGSENPIGQFVNLNTQIDLLVTGVYKNPPTNSTFHDAGFVTSMELIYNAENPFTWDNYNMRVFAELQSGVDHVAASAAIRDMMKPHKNPEDGTIELFLLPMKDWHLRSEFRDGNSVTSKRLTFVNMYAVIGGFVLLLACINFMNLNTARYQNRAKEVGIRKAIGSVRSQLIMQFLSESFLYALASFIISMGAVLLILPWFNEISDKQITFPWNNGLFWVFGLVFTISAALIAGSYPALLLSSFGPIKALRGAIQQGTVSSKIRQGLVVFQFSISILLIIGTLTIFSQVEHGKSRPVGYNQDDLIMIRGRSADFYEKYDVLRNELKQSGAVLEVATANYPLMNTLGNNDGFRLAATDERIDFTFNTIYITPEYGTTTQWELIAGRDFTRDQGDESGNIIVSELAIQKMGLTDPIGTKISSRGNFNYRDNFTIIGVVRDMIKGSPFEQPVPLMLFANEEPSSFLFARLNPSESYLTSLPKIEKVFSDVLPAHPFNYEFINDSYATKFRDEERVSSLASLFSVLAIIISCLGLFGLSAFVVEQRTKEIGIRKILGANPAMLWLMLSKGFTLLVIAASILSIPVAIYAIDWWLADYAYRIPIPYALFGLSCMGGLFIALLTISYHTLKAAVSNPVLSLRSE